MLVALNDVGVLQLVQQLHLPQAAPPCLLIHHLKDLHLQPGAVSQASAPQSDAAVAQLQAAEPGLCQSHALGSALQEGFKLLVRRNCKDGSTRLSLAADPFDGDLCAVGLVRAMVHLRELS